MGNKQKSSKQKIKTLKTLDLHAFREDDVFDAVEDFLNKNTNQSEVRIMTGKGKGIVLKKVKEYLKLAGYPSRFEKQADGNMNTGVLIIKMD